MGCVMGSHEGVMGKFIGGVMGCIMGCVIWDVIGVVMFVFVFIPSLQREGSPFFEGHWTSK